MGSGMYIPIAIFGKYANTGCKPPHQLTSADSTQAGQSLRIEGGDFDVMSGRWWKADFFKYLAETIQI